MLQIIFLDQPLNVGYSYSTDGSTINNTPAAAEDVWAFLQLFFKQYPEVNNGLLANSLFPLSTLFSVR